VTGFQKYLGRVKCCEEKEILIEVNKRALQKNRFKAVFFIFSYSFLA